MTFDRNHLPDAVHYFEAEGLPLVGKGKWRTTRCDFHGGTDSMRVNTASGGWCCMACHLSGGDVLALHMERHGLGFIDAARALGAWIDDGKAYAGPRTPPPLPARDAMQLAAHELRVAFVVISDVRSGVIPSDEDWQRFIGCAGRVEALAQEYAA